MGDMFFTRFLYKDPTTNYSNKEFVEIEVKLKNDIKLLNDKNALLKKLIKLDKAGSYTKEQLEKMIEYNEDDLLPLYLDVKYFFNKLYFERLKDFMHKKIKFFEF